MLSFYSITGPGRQGGAHYKRAAKRSRPGKEVVSDEEPEIMPEKTTRRQKSNAAKIKAAQSKSLTLMSAPEFMKERRMNPYATQRLRNYTTPTFHNLFQEKIFYEVLPKHKTKVCTQYCINTEYMENHPAYFGEAIAMCKEFGIYDYINFEQNYNEHLVMQFFATVHFFNDEPRRIKWMSKNQVLEAKWSQFASLLGLSEHGFELDEAAHQQFFRINYNTPPMKPDVLYDLYIPGRAVVGQQKNLLKVWDIMHRIYRNTVAPRVGNFDQLHGKMIDLMHESHRMQGQGKKLDVMDVLWHEMYSVVMKRRPAIFGPHIMTLIVDRWTDLQLDLELLDNEEAPTNHNVKELQIKKHLPPLIPNVEESSADDEDDPLFELPPRASAKDRNFKKWMADALKTIFCRQEDSDKRAYKAHVRHKQERQLTRKRFEHLGVPCKSGSEDRITAEHDWLKSRRTWVDADLQDDASTSQQPDIPWSRTHIGRTNTSSTEEGGSDNDDQSGEQDGSGGEDNSVDAATSDDE